MNLLNFLIPEILLSISIFSFLMAGVFLKNSFEIIYKASIILIFIILLVIITGENETSKIFNESFVVDNFSIYSKLLILFSTFFILLISKRYISDIKNRKFE